MVVPPAIRTLWCSILSRHRPLKIPDRISELQHEILFQHIGHIILYISARHGTGNALVLVQYVERSKAYFQSLFLQQFVSGVCVPQVKVLRTRTAEGCIVVVGDISVQIGRASCRERVSSPV